ncbi:hypothetical protein ANN_20370 [Periplaneta americana]|uniref:ISXO2-like transposase domain-containing protein n=1 Tax=Periplaneta americana TaxID=6978 RepID=A0ABQ8SD84_PERAM|nr:hypothetical protein ANN_20370 [Periplaneta americana]
MSLLHSCTQTGALRCALVVSCILILVALAGAQDEKRPKISDEALERALNDKRYLQRQLKCALGEASCDPVGRRLKINVEKRDTATLLPLIIKWIKPGTRIMTDQWEAYKEISEHNFQHSIVNHSLEFVNAEDLSVHTQNVERMWRCVKETMRKHGRPHYHGFLYLSEFIYRHKKGNHSAPTMFLPFLEDISLVYPGLGKVGMTGNEVEEIV